MSKDFFKKPFDDGTKIKLEIFGKYLETWLPTFTKDKNRSWENIFIFDLFAGSGMDSEGNNGSPLIIVEELKRHYWEIQEKALNIHVIFNDSEKDNIDQLESTINSQSHKRPYKISYFNKDFNELFNELYPYMLRYRNFPMLLFLDQFGIKNITEEVMSKILKLKRTDLLFFISSSFVRRFSELKEFQRYLNISKEDFDETRPFHCHRTVTKYYQSMIPENIEYFLAPFSIKKNKNIYGLIFGSKHSFGIEKFLNIVWRLNPNSGDANYNIDEEEIAEGKLSLFPEYNVPRKLQYFEQELNKEILAKELISIKQIYAYTFNFGCLPKHANKVIKEMVKERKIANTKTYSQNIHRINDERIEVIT